MSTAKTFKKKNLSISTVAMAQNNLLASILANMKQLLSPEWLPQDQLAKLTATPLDQVAGKVAPPRSPGLGIRRGAHHVGQQGMSPDLPNPHVERYPRNDFLPLRVPLDQKEVFRRERRRKHLELTKKDLEAQFAWIDEVEGPGFAMRQPKSPLPAREDAARKEM